MRPRHAASAGPFGTPMAAIEAGSRVVFVQSIFHPDQSATSPHAVGSGLSAWRHLVCAARSGTSRQYENPRESLAAEMSTGLRSIGGTRRGGDAQHSWPALDYSSFKWLPLHLLKLIRAAMSWLQDDPP